MAQLWHSGARDSSTDARATLAQIGSRVRSWSRERPHSGYSYQRCPGANKGSQTWCALDTSTLAAAEHIDEVLAADLIDALTAAHARGVADAAIAADNAPPRPFFIMGGFVRPHGPWMMPSSAWLQYNDTHTPLPTHPSRVDGPMDAPYHGWTDAGIEFPPTRRHVLSDGRVVWLPGGANATAEQHSLFTVSAAAHGTVPPAQARAARHAYWAACTYVDAQIGRVLRHLSALQLEQSTLVIAHSDHGERSHRTGHASAAPTRTHTSTSPPGLAPSPSVCGLCFLSCTCARSPPPTSPRASLAARRCTRMDPHHSCVCVHPSARRQATTWVSLARGARGRCTSWPLASP